MKLKQSLFFLFALTAFGVASTILSIFNYNPYLSNNLAFANFYASLFVGIAGILSIAIYYIKIKISKNETIYSYFWPSVRQSVFVSAAITAILYLRGIRILDWLIGISVLIVAVLLELFFESRKSKVKN